MAITFMAKYDQREGSSCHVHLSLRDADDAPRVRRPAGGVRRLHGRACSRRCRSSRCCYAPNINSYKRFASASFAPTAVAWGTDNRTCALRVARRTGKGKRVELRMPGADVNPYLALAALIAGGLHGVELGLPLEPPVERQRVRDRPPARARRRCTRRATSSRPARSRARRSATRSSTTTSTTRASSSRRSTPPSPTGNASAGSSGCRCGAGPTRTRRSTRSSRPSARRRPSRRPSTGSGRRSSSGS